ncbi:TRIO and F-actin-binding protein [Camelus dromedarius]|uniref:TRIO and F-actin-binding protein n=1 Tax=Camelus dromedarius TaxID=9838 RepID=A0A5N4DGI1_CAMDR|nr:TRIO and F-actin-binding protein [Camelus dromedarius]
MEGMAGNAPCGHFEANVLTQSCCQNCFHPEEAHRAVYQGKSHESVSSPRGPSAGLPAEGLTAAPRSQEPEAVPYLPSSLCGSFNESSDSGTSSSPDCDAPDDTSNSSSVDWDTVERPEEVPSGDKFAVMIPRKPQEGPRADSTQRAPLLARSPVGGDAAGQRKEARFVFGKDLPERDEDLVPRVHMWGAFATIQTPPPLRVNHPITIPPMFPQLCALDTEMPLELLTPRHTQFDPFPFLPDTSDAENQSPQHDPPQFPQPVCIGYRDAPRASSPPRQAPEPSLLFQDLPRASTESLAPSTDSLHEHPHIPTPVCIGHRDAPSFSSPPRQAPEPSLFFQDLPGTSMESLAPSIDSLRGSPMLPPQVCIGHRDAPRASSPPRHPPSDLVLLATSPPPGSSGGSRGSVPPGEARHNLEREEYTVLADLPPPRRLAQREPGPQGSNGGRTRSPGRAEVERLFGQERRGVAAFAHRKSEAPGAFQARDEGRSQRPSQGQSQLLRRQSSPALSREVSTARLPPAPAPPRDRDHPAKVLEPHPPPHLILRLDWEGLLELLQAQLPCKDPAGHWGGPATASPGTKGTLELEQERHNQPEGAAGATLLNGYSPGQWPQSSAQPPSPASVSTQWPKTKVTGGPETSTMADLEKGQLGSKSPAEGPSSPLGEFQSKEPKESERSRGQDSLTDQKQADSVVGVIEKRSSEELRSRATFWLGDLGG